MFAFTMATCEADNLLIAHCVVSAQLKLPCSTSCIEVAYADFTVNHGNDVASLAAKMTCIIACFNVTIPCI